MAIRYAIITDTEGFDQVTDLEVLVWGMPERSAITPHIQRVITHIGGIVYGAFDGDRLAGFVLGLPTHQADWLWSHIAAVHPDYQRQGIGYALKQKQREWALEQGYTRMSWTTDPLMSANAHFNFHLLNANTYTYHVNFYGIHDDAINAGIETDRFQIIWYLDEPPRVVQSDDAPFALTLGGNRAPLVHAVDLDRHDSVRVAIPCDYNAIKRADKPLAIRWREQSRQVFIRLHDAGYTVVDFVRAESGACWYVFGRC